jgi:hypothetical protein
MPHMFRDDNAKSMSSTAGMRPAYGAVGILVATTGAATAEVDATAALLLGRNASGSAIVRVICHTNACMFAFGVAGAAASYTTNDNMVYLAANTPEYFRVDSTDVSFYHIQITGAGTVQVTVMK